MEITIGVVNFGKIESAEITLGDFTVFVGDNNSGKTFMMQLIYGVFLKMSRMSVTCDGMIRTGDYGEYGAEWVQAWENQINNYLEQNKEQIVTEIFCSPVNIEKLYVRFSEPGDKYICQFRDWEYEEYDNVPGKTGRKEAVVEKRIGKVAEIHAVSLDDGKSREGVKLHFSYHMSRGSQDLLWNHVAQWITGDLLGWENYGWKSLLFLPASRTGLLLLYKYFFSEKDKRQIEENNLLLAYVRELQGVDLRGIGLQDMGQQQNDLGLSAPVYDFLQFLLRYTPNSSVSAANRELLQFIEKNMLEGRVKQAGDDTFYFPKQSKEPVPLYLASSLVNEMTPLVKALSGARDYKYIFYDEVETCLHPLKQSDMARLLFRLVNSGRKMVVSTHSDTMAAKINNLLLLSCSPEDSVREKKLRKLKLKDSDLLHSQKVHAYQFVNNKNGTSTAKELEFRVSPFVGYEFALFEDNLDRLFRESGVILE